jgi:hypothetical protein
MLDFDAALAEADAPPLFFPDASFEEIQAPTAFTLLVDDWAEWLLEARRLLGEGGRLVIGLAGQDEFERLAACPWQEAGIGMTVLSALDGPGRRTVFHSDWWIRAHWGRAFEIVEMGELDGRRRVVLHRAPAEVTADQLRRPEPGDDRELAAAQANAGYLGEQLDRTTQDHRRELDEQREEMSRELMRRSFAAADAEWARGGPGSPASLVAAEYEATTSWRMTKPLRTLGRLLRRDP